MDEHEIAFKNVKKLFIDTVVLAYPDPDKPFLLYTDASHKAIGASLGQVDEEGNERVITFISRTLRGPEIRYYTTEKEILAIIYALERLRNYVAGSKIILKTDHQAIIFLIRCKLSNSRLMRWMLFLQDYDLEFQFIPGVTNKIADFLSRQEYYDEGTSKIISAIKLNLPREPSSEILNILKIFFEFQDKDSKISKLKKQISKLDPNYYKMIGNLLYVKHKKDLEGIFTKGRYIYHIYHIVYWKL